MTEEMRKHLIKTNVVGLVNGGIALGEAIDMAWDLSEPLFSERLRMKRKTIVGSGGSGGGGTKAGGAGRGHDSGPS